MTLRSSILSFTLVVLLALAVAVPALAASPETPQALPAQPVGATTATLRGVLNPNASHLSEPGEYQFLYNHYGSECQNGGEGTPSLPAEGHQGEAVQAEVSGLLPASKYTFCVYVINAEGQAFSAPETFETQTAAPSVGEESYLGLDADEVTVTAAINPGGLPTSYQVEYEPGKRTAAETLPASGTPVSVRERLTGLTPASEYHFHFIAENTLGGGEGVIETFKTAAAGSSGSEGATTACANSTFAGFNVLLPDCRADELVSPAEEVGDLYSPGGTTGREQDVTTARPYRAAAAGAAVAYLATPGLVGGEGSVGLLAGNEYLARRGANAGPQGWETLNITPPAAEGESASLKREYASFSSDLSVGLVSSEGTLLGADPRPQAPVGCAALYWRTDGEGPDSVFGSEYHALFSETQTPPNCGPVGRANKQGRDNKLIFAGESADHTQRLLQTPAALTSGATETVGFGSNLYDSTGATLTPVNVLPGGEVEANATFGGPSGMPGNAPDLSRAISSAGSRVFWSSVERGEGLGEEPVARAKALYAREDPLLASARTVQLDLPQGVGGEGGHGRFWAASSDGTEVFFTDCIRLTTDSTADSSEGCERLTPGGVEEVQTGNDLYEYDFAKPAGERLVDLTVDHNLADPRGADVQGVIGASEDGSYVYFVAGGALTTEPNSRGETPTFRVCESSLNGSEEAEEKLGHLPTGKGCNLYVEHSDGVRWERPRFIGALGAKDNAMVEVSLNAPYDGQGRTYGDWVADLGSRTAEVSPDGRHLVFMSIQQLTGYDTSAVSRLPGGEGGSEVFVYQASDGALACASCNPSGVPPVAAIESSGGYASYLPVSSSDTFMHRWMNAQGSEVFFDSSQPLVAADSNGVQDVYEWEREGSSASCPVATSIYGGCVFLLSGGESSDFSFLVDADETGENVFFTHRGQLGGAGPHDDKVHLYDVRVGGGFSESSLACEGTGCQGVPPAPPAFATPASVTFSGPGNLAPARAGKAKAKPKHKPARRCSRGRVRNRHGRCVKRSKHKAKAGKAGHERRTGR